MVKFSKELKEKMEYLNIKYHVPAIELVRLVNEAQDEVEVPDCSDCTHKRFHEDPRPSWA